MNPIMVILLFEVSVIDFMWPFERSYRMKYILVAVDYVSKWMEAIMLPIIKAKSVTALLKNNIFSRFGIPEEIISNVGIHFCNKFFKILNENYDVFHNVATPYYPWNSGQVEVSNKEIKIMGRV